MCLSPQHYSRVLSLEPEVRQTLKRTQPTDTHGNSWLVSALGPDALLRKRGGICDDNTHLWLSGAQLRTPGGPGWLHSLQDPQQSCPEPTRERRGLFCVLFLHWVFVWPASGQHRANPTNASFSCSVFLTLWPLGA